MNSNDLKITQTTLEQIVKTEIDSPMTNYTKVKRLMQIIKEVDALRRETWHDEKFGKYDNIVDASFTADDIPF